MIVIAQLEEAKLQIEKMYFDMIDQEQIQDTPHLRHRYFSMIEEAVRETPNPDPVLQSMMLFHLALKKSLCSVEIIVKNQQTK